MTKKILITLAILTAAATNAHAVDCNSYRHPMHVSQCKIDLASRPTGETVRNAIRTVFGWFNSKTPYQEYQEQQAKRNKPAGISQARYDHLRAQRVL